MPDDSIVAATELSRPQHIAASDAAWSPDLLRKIALLAFGYGITGALGLLLAVPPGYATAVWPASGIALAGLLAWGSRAWPGIWLGSFLVNVWAAYADGSVDLLSLGVAANIAVGSTVQALLAALLIRKWVGVNKLFEAAPSAVAFAVLTAICCLIASTWGVATLKLAGFVEFGTVGESWRTWWLGDFIGILVVTPTLLTWRYLLPTDSRPWYVTETIGTLVLLTIVTALVFYYQAPPGVVAYPITFLPLPFLVWIACRTNPGGVSFALCLVSAIGVVATSNGTGPFARDTTNESLLFLQTFIGMTTLMGLTLAAAVCGHRNSTESLRKLTVELQQMALTDDLTGIRNRRGFLLIADHAWKLARRAHVRCLLMFIDVDNLKTVNDTQGHRKGDELLIDTGRVLSDVFRETDVIARVGGDEFAILEVVDAVEPANAGSKRLRDKIEEFNRYEGRSYTLAMSYGIEELPPTAEMSLEMFLARADAAMYERKRARRQMRDEANLEQQRKPARNP